jgi:hypothetical protein
MKKVCTTALLLFACSAWMAAQTTSSSTQGDTGSSASSNSGASQSGSSRGYPTEPDASSESGTSDSGNASQSGTASGSTAPSSSEIRETSIQGCLQGSNGNYTLTDQMANVHRLQGKEADLSTHVGQEIEAKGFQTSASNASPSGSSSNAGTSSSMGNSVSTGESAAAFQVHELTTLSNVCTTNRK